jgi:hypothetical protein
MKLPHTYENYLKLSCPVFLYTIDLRLLLQMNAHCNAPLLYRNVAALLAFAMTVFVLYTTATTAAAYCLVLLQLQATR